MRAVAHALGAPYALIWKTPTADLQTLNPGRPDEEALGVTYDLLEGKQVDDESAFAAIVRRYGLTEHERQPPITP
jgi:NAD+ synthase